MTPSQCWLFICSLIHGVCTWHPPVVMHDVCTSHPTVVMHEVCTSHLPVVIHEVCTSHSPVVMHEVLWWYMKFAPHTLLWLWSDISKKLQIDIHHGYTFKRNFLSLPWYTQEIANSVVPNHCQCNWRLIYKTNAYYVQVNV